MWRDIALANRDALLAEIDAYRAQLDRIAALIGAGDGAALEAHVRPRARRAPRVGARVAQRLRGAEPATPRTTA